MPGLINNAVKRLDSRLAAARKPDSDDQAWTATITQAHLLTEYADHALNDLVREARERGVTWEAIGHAIGTSRQNAQQRFGSSLNV